MQSILIFGFIKILFGNIKVVLYLSGLNTNNMSMILQKASRKKVKMRLGLSAVSGGGKTYTALLIAYGMCEDWNKIAVIDTENNSASLYSHLGPFNTIELTAPYTPERYSEAIKACEDAGMEVIIVDSITHEWDGKGGILSISDSMTGNSYTNWAKITPRHQAFIDSILQSKCHVITTVRRKQDYEMTKDSNGKLQVQKLGLKEITREGFEYEVTVNLEMDVKHNATASKDRTGLFIDKPAFMPSIETGKLIKKWCDEGIDTPPPIDPLAAILANMYAASNLAEVQTMWAANKKYQTDKKFVAAKDQMKAKLLEKNEDVLANTQTH